MSDRTYWLERLSSWSDPASFAQLVSECDAAMGRFAAMTQHGTQFWRDAWIAAAFSKFVAAERVRLLHPQPFPDFELVLGGECCLFEATEALQPGRRRGDEFREDLEKEEKGEPTARPHPSEDWLTPKRTFDLLEKAAKRKSEKPYATACGLVIYLNDSDYGSDTEGVVGTFQSATKCAGRRFQSVHILWDSRCFLVWNNGHPA